MENKLNQTRILCKKNKQKKSFSNYNFKDLSLGGQVIRCVSMLDDLKVRREGNIKLHRMQQLYMSIETRSSSFEIMKDFAIRWTSTTCSHLIIKHLGQNAKKYIRVDICAYLNHLPDLN